MTHILVTVDVAGPDIFPDKLICYGQRMGTKFMWRCLLHQGDINCGPSSHPDFIKNYFLSNFLSNSPFPPIPDGRMEQLMSPCRMV